MTTERKKPSERIREATLAKAEALMALGLQNEGVSIEEYRSLSADERAEFEEKVAMPAWNLAIVEWLDAEHERRAKFEQDITERVWALEGKAGKAE